MIAPEMLARFPPGTTADDAAAFVRAAGGNLSAAVEMCISGHQVPTTSGSSTARTTAQPAVNQRRAPAANNYFVGGGESSGQAVIAPTPAASRGRATEGGAVENIFAKAKENGARDASGGAHSSNSSDQAFAGTGRRLGHLEGPSPVMQATRRLKKTIRITFYEDGFQIEDGELRSLTDDAGRVFLESINRGYIPRELVANLGDVDLDVSLVDRREEPYTAPPPPAYVAFAGSGRTLAAAPSSSAAAAPPTASSAAPRQADSAAAPQQSVVVDPQQETCKLVIMNLTGVRSEHSVNPMRHTVRDLRVLASALQGTPALPLQSFQLMVRDVPPRLLAGDDMTIDAAKCRNATIMMKRL